MASRMLMIPFSFVELSAATKTLLMPFCASTTTQCERYAIALLSINQTLKMPPRWL